MSKKFVSRWKPKAWGGYSASNHRYRRHKVKVLSSRQQPRHQQSHLSETQAYLYPYISSASWLYLNTNPQITSQPKTTPSYANLLPPPSRRVHHHYYHQMLYETNHSWKNSLRQRHARVYDDDSEEEVTRASTFRKVPWHPNLHMLKIRRA